LQKAPLACPATGRVMEGRVRQVTRLKPTRKQDNTGQAQSVRCFLCTAHSGRDQRKGRGQQFWGHLDRPAWNGGVPAAGRMSGSGMQRGQAQDEKPTRGHASEVHSRACQLQTVCAHSHEVTTRGTGSAAPAAPASSFAESAPHGTWRYPRRFGVCQSNVASMSEGRLKWLQWPSRYDIARPRLTCSLSLS